MKTFQLETKITIKYSGEFSGKYFKTGSSQIFTVYNR